MRKFFTISLASIFGLALVSTAAFAAYGENSKLAGYVKETNTLVPLAKAKVKIYKKNGKLKDTDRTNSKGKYSFSDLDSGTYRVKATMEGYRNPKNFNKEHVSKTVKVNGSDRKNLYMQKI
ncbi:MAG: hypothetical protein ACD_15C00212G0018 [uncultured bacterium]|nr:MAG: hypothetical protein ACD_15C00212G0018 [uncultured bacterium]HCU70551.1 hypothetical protein [Candidatus Moranbacteria bacterium]